MPKLMINSIQNQVKYSRNQQELLDKFSKNKKMMNLPQNWGVTLPCQTFHYGGNFRAFMPNLGQKQSKVGVFRANGRTGRPGQSILKVKNPVWSNLSKRERWPTKLVFFLRIRGWDTEGSNALWSEPQRLKM